VKIFKLAQDLIRWTSLPVYVDQHNSSKICHKLKMTPNKHTASKCVSLNGFLIFAVIVMPYTTLYDMKCTKRTLIRRRLESVSESHENRSGLYVFLTERGVSTVLCGSDHRSLPRVLALHAAICKTPRRTAERFRKIKHTLVCLIFAAVSCFQACVTVNNINGL